MAFIALSVNLFYPSFQSEKPNDAEGGNDGWLPNKTTRKCRNKTNKGVPHGERDPM